MSQVSRAASKLKYQTGDVPTQGDYEDLHDSIIWYDEAADAGVKYCRGLITQTNSNNPVLTILKNTTGTTFNASYEAMGQYTISPAIGVFVVNNTAFTMGQPYNQQDPTTPVHLNYFLDVPGQGIVIRTYDQANNPIDDVLTNVKFEIIIYP